MIDYSHPARHAHHVAAHGLRTAFVTTCVTTGARAWTIVRPAGAGLAQVPVGAAGRGAHRPAPVSLVKA